MKYILILSLLFVACKPTKQCIAPDASDGGITPSSNPCMIYGKPLPDGAQCCLGAKEGTCKSSECVAN